MKKLWLIGLILVLAFSITACGGEDAPGEAPAENNNEASNPEESVANSGISSLEVVELITAEWRGTGHEFAAVSPAERGISCARCHDGYGFAEQAKYLGTDVEYEPAHITGIGCQSCHSGFGKELTETGIVELPFIDEPYQAGTGAVCLSCHNSNREPADLFAQSEAGELGRLSYPHYGMAGALFTGLGGMEDPSISYSSSAAHANLENSCVSCHMPVTEEGYMEHSFVMQEEYIEQTCASCHSGIDTFNLNGLQDDIKAMLDKVEAAIIADTGASEIDAGGGQFIFRDAAGEQMDAADISHEAYVAAYNWRMVKYDGSYGVHNPQYANSLLQESYKLLTGEDL